MRSVRLVAAMMMGVVAWMAPSSRALADAVLYDSAGFVQGQQSFTTSFNITAPGTLTVSLSNVAWLDPVADLNCFLTTATGVVGSAMGAGTESMKLGTGTYYAHWFGNAKGQYGIGVVGLKVMFQAQGVTPVPLPDSLILLLSAIGFSVLWQWRHRAAALLLALAWTWRSPGSGEEEPGSFA